MASLDMSSSGSPFRPDSSVRQSQNLNFTHGSHKAVNTSIRDDMNSGRLKLTPAIRQPLPSSRLSVFNDVTLLPNEMDLFTMNTTVNPLNKTLSNGMWPKVSDKLYTEFLESLLVHSSEQQIFDIVKDFIQNCDNTLALLRESSKSTIPMANVWLQNERNTWRLLFCLYQNRVSTSQREALQFPEDRGEMNVDEEDEIDNVSRKLSESYVVKKLYENDAVVRECQLVIDWLEQCAADHKNDDNGPQLGHFTDKTVAWENTVHQLKNSADGVVYGSRRPIVSKVDPDAPIRERRHLHDLDEDDENRLMQHVFVEIRCGRLETAQSLCYHCGQPWRAAVLEGWRLHNDPNYANNNTVAGKEPVEGNPSRDLWKISAWRMSQDQRLPLYARAAIAAHCGNLKVIQSACTSWADVLWGHLRCVVDVRVEREIRSQIHRTYIDMPEEYWQNELSLDQIFAELGSNSRDEVREAAQEPKHKVQELLIQEQIGFLLTEMENWARRGEPQMLRFLAHLVLVLRLLGHSDHAGDQVLREYVKVLVNMRDPRLVAHYVAMLPQDDQVQEYAAFLMTVVDHEERQVCLSVAEEAGLDIEKITTTVVENIRKQEKSSLLSEETTPADIEKISALDWVVFYPTQRAEALWQANALMRSFLAAGKLDATSKAFARIPDDSIRVIYNQVSAETSFEDRRDLDLQQLLPYRCACSVREYLCFKEYLIAQERFSDWFQHFHNAKPVKPTQPRSDAQFQEKIAYDHRMAQYENKFEHWKKTMNSLTKTVCKQLYNVLLFPDGGWLVDPAPSVQCRDELMESASEDSDMNLRQIQMDKLRRLYIPKVALLLHTVLHEMGEYAECVQLADLIASEQRQLYLVYSKEDLGDLLMKIAESSLELLEQKKDPWGLPPL